VQLIVHNGPAGRPGRGGRGLLDPAPLELAELEEGHALVRFACALALHAFEVATGWLFPGAFAAQLLGLLSDQPPGSSSASPHRCDRQRSAARRRAPSAAQAAGLIVRTLRVRVAGICTAELTAV
jgi:hypothetical protein